ncbi:MAG: hypothetical protein KGQ52_06985 [Alphaproteobacteria bacterium]|nr:hypothetical protein [Alphaproteobacteria bacterium]
MIYIVVNAIPIGIATLLGLALAQFIDRPRGLGGWIIALVSAGWLGAILAGALILAPPRAPVWVMTIGSAVVIWAGFVVPALATSLHLAGQRWQRIGRACSWWLAVMLVEAVVMRLIGLTPP